MAELIQPGNYQDFTLEMLQTPTGIAKLNSILSQLSANITGDTESVKVYQGVGTPEASVAAGVGSLYMRTDGGADTSVYRKESGSGNTGWVAIKAPASLPLSVANGGTGSDNSAVVQGVIPYFSATGVISGLATGTSGQFLKTQGASANPTWATVIPNYIAGDYLIFGPTRSGTTTNNTLTKVAEVYILKSGTLRVRYWAVQNGSGIISQVYRNGSAVGTSQNGLGEFSEDISGWTVS